MKWSKRDMLALNEIFNTLYVYESPGIWVEKQMFMVRDVLRSMNLIIFEIKNKQYFCPCYQSLTYQ